ncbi:MAG: hypothetical protein J7559_01835, partial [Cohnella sp.]|nr:hypothetical protein [Cohnella sp.]
MSRLGMKFARAALALTVAWQAVSAWAGTDRAGAVPSGQWIWESVGTGPVENSLTQTFDITVHNNVPYLFYNYASSGGRGIVKAWDGTSWARVGDDFVSAGTMRSASIDIGEDGQIYVAYSDGRTGNPYKAVVRKLSNGSWVELDGSGPISSAPGSNYAGVVAGLGGKPFTYYQEVGSTQTF